MGILGVIRIKVCSEYIRLEYQLPQLHSSNADTFFEQNAFHAVMFSEETHHHKPLLSSLDLNLFVWAQYVHSFLYGAQASVPGGPTWPLVQGLTIPEPIWLSRRRAFRLGHEALPKEHMDELRAGRIQNLL